MAPRAAAALVLALGLLCAAATTARAASPTYKPLYTCASPLRPGGIVCQPAVAASSSNAAINAAATFAASKLGANLKVVAVLNAGSQVVAGTNYYVTLVLATPAGSFKIVQAKVFQPLPVPGTPQGLQLVASQRVPDVALTAAAARANVSAAPFFKCGAPGLPGGLACTGVDATARASAAAAFNGAVKGAMTGGAPQLLETVAPYATQVVAGMNQWVSFVVGDAAGAMSVVQASVWQQLGNAGNKVTGWTVVTAPAAAATPLAPAAAPKTLFSCPGTAGVAGGVTCKPVDATAQSVATFAVTALNAEPTFILAKPVTLTKVINYGTQVVAGTNSFETLSVATPDKRAHLVQVVVYTDLSGKRALTKWVVLS